MKVLLLDVDNVGYELVKPEASVYEDSDEKNVSVDDALVMMVSVEQEDDEAIADKAIEDVLGVMREPCLTLSDPEVAPNGLFVDADVKTGPNWAEMKGIKGI